MSLSKIQELSESIKKYVDVRFELLRIDTEEKITRTNRLLFKVGLALSFLVLFVLFINLSLAFFLNSLLGSIYLGFLIVAFLQILLIPVAIGLSRLFGRTLAKLIKAALRNAMKEILED